MDYIIEGKAYLLGDNIDTDQIYPGRYLELTDKGEIAEHFLEGVRPELRRRIKQGDILVAGRNFGSGSSREHAAITIKESGIGAIIARSFSRIFFRNAINLGLPLLTCNFSDVEIREGDILIIELGTGVIKNKTTECKYIAEGLPEFVLKLIQSGGVKAQKNMGTELQRRQISWRKTTTRAKPD